MNKRKSGSTIWLLSILGALLLLYVVVREFRQEWVSAELEVSLVKGSKEQVDSILILRPEENVELEKRDSIWYARVYNAQDSLIMEPADTVAIYNFLSELYEGARPSRLYGKGTGRWEELRLSDSLATRVRVFHSGEVMVDILLGYSARSTRGAITYLREHGSENVYIAERIPNEVSGGSINDFRKKTVTRSSGLIPRRITFTYAEDLELISKGTFVLEKGDVGDWTLNGEAVDEKTVQDYIRFGLNKSASRICATIGDRRQPLPICTLRVEHEDGTIHEVHAWKEDGIPSSWILRSSLNPSAWYADNVVWKDIFKTRAYFLEGEI